MGSESKLPRAIRSPRTSRAVKKRLMEPSSARLVATAKVPSSCRSSMRGVGSPGSWLPSSDVPEAPEIANARGARGAYRPIYAPILNFLVSLSISAPEYPLAYIPPTIAPMLVPTIMSGTIPSESSTLITPTCAIPLTPPPGRTRATLPTLVAGHADAAVDCAPLRTHIGETRRMATRAPAPRATTVLLRIRPTTSPSPASPYGNSLHPSTRRARAHSRPVVRIRPAERARRVSARNLRRQGWSRLRP